jgi:hypothetical protein
MRSVVLIRGLLRGMGREVPCEMLAIRESHSQTGQAVYSRCSVIDAPMDLPDGVYTVAFNGYTVSARKEAGLWMPEGTTTPVLSSEKPAGDTPSFRVEDAIEILPILKGKVA